MSFGKNILAGVAALTMVATPTIAMAASAGKLSVSAPQAGARVGATSEARESSLAGGSVIIAVLAAAAVIAGIIIAADGDDDAVSG